ncbi:MAG: hypothetical protein E6R05_03180 [Candidatus Moraniibacteriota bacterium]|nr:MAG: hypothetical protein E6R05_03180 [Candidatus Moranbacteria bacterium]
MPRPPKSPRPPQSPRPPRSPPRSPRSPRPPSGGWANTELDTNTVPTKIGARVDRKAFLNKMLNFWIPDFMVFPCFGGLWSRD